MKFSLYIKATGIIATILLSLMTSGCGSSGNGGGSSQSANKIEAAFLRSASEFGIPYRILLAVAYLESGMSPESSSALYLAEGSSENVDSKELRFGQSAFGIPLDDFNFEEGEDTSGLEAQVRGYARYIREKLDRENIKLSVNPVTSEDKIQWLLKIAEFHRQSKINSSSLHALFSRELVQVLNNGFYWQDPNTKMTIRLNPEAPEIRISELSDRTKRSLNIFTQTGDAGAQKLQLLVLSQPQTNNPKNITFVHCPLTASACLAMQDYAEDETRLGAHFIVPNTMTPDVLDHAIQVRGLDEAVDITGTYGDTVQVNNSIVVMLTGNSGRYVDGVRLRANPTWVTEEQLQAAGLLVNRLCNILHNQNFNKVRECVATGGDLGINYWHQGKSKVYRWGDVADFDQTIFESYMQMPEQKGGVAFDFPGRRVQYRAGENINFSVNFDTSAKLLVLQRMVRCRDNRVVWFSEYSAQFNSVTRHGIQQKQIYDAGPNHNGDQFLRALVYRGTDELLGWATVKLQITNFDEEYDSVPTAPAECN
jgi:hypothetical protein